MQFLSFLFKRFKTNNKRRLYQQWVDGADLPPEAIPREEPDEENSRQIEREQPGFSIPFLLLIISFIISCLALIIVTVHVC